MKNKKRIKKYCLKLKKIIVNTFTRELLKLSFNELEVVADIQTFIQNILEIINQYY